MSRVPSEASVARVDALLASWPTPERTALAWDEFADRIMTRLDVEPGLGIDEDAKFLLAPTLNGAKDSVAEAPMSHSSVPTEELARQSRQQESFMGVSQRDRRSSLQDLARMANEGPRSSRASGVSAPDSLVAPPVSHLSRASSARVDEGSGVVDLQSLAALPEVPASRGSVGALGLSGELATSDTFEVAAVPASEVTPPSMRESVPPMPLSIAPAALSDSGITQPRRMSGPGVGVVFGGLVGVLAVAAGALFFVVSKKAPATDAAQASTTVVAPAEKAPETAAVAAVAQVAQADQAVQAEQAGKAPDVATDPGTLPVGTSVAGNVDSSRHGRGVKDSAAAAAAGPSKKEADAKKAVAAPEPPPPSGIPDNELGAQMKKAAGPGVVGTGVDNKADAQFAAGTVPQRPSQGTLTSALGRVMGKAKACIGPDDPISRANVVFASAGTVQSVSVSGNAAGKPAEACIKTALSGAKLNTPFAEPTYTTTLTIRP